jgi:hypothetical protein
MRPEPIDPAGPAREAGLFLLSALVVPGASGPITEKAKTLLVLVKAGRRSTDLKLAEIEIPPKADAMSASLSVIARRLSFIRETDGPNAGSWVNWLQRHGGDGVEGDSWCADFESVVEDIAYKGKAPLPRTGSCQTKLEYAMKTRLGGRGAAGGRRVLLRQRRRDTRITSASSPHPIPSSPASLGNTSADGASSNGDGVWEHELNVSRAHIVFVRLPQ